MNYAVYEFEEFSVEPDVALPEDACSFRFPFGGRQVLA